MFGFLAAFGPVGIAAAVVGTVGAAAYGAFKDDDYDTTTYSNKSEKEAEAREHKRTEIKHKIEQEIKAYKQQQMKRLKEKYDVDVEFNSATIGSSSESSLFQNIFLNIVLPINKDIFDKRTAEKIKINKKDGIDSISILENETEEMIKLIEKLEVDKHASTN